MKKKNNKIEFQDKGIKWLVAFLIIIVILTICIVAIYVLKDKKPSPNPIEEPKVDMYTKDNDLEKLKFKNEVESYNYSIPSLFTNYEEFSKYYESDSIK